MKAGRGRPRKPDEPYVPPTEEERVAGLVMRCRACGLERRLSDFSDAQRRSSWPQCITCARHRSRATHERLGKDYVRAKNLQKNYGLSLDDVHQMRTRQGNRCPICNEELGATHEETAVDHCYRTGLIRGLLHPWCNTGLGHFRDDPERLRRAAAYLEAAALQLRDGRARFIPACRLGRRPGT